jgi:ubiquitin-activating enzyme E1
MDKVEIDQNLYSRQIGAYGAEAMGRLVQLKVLVHGLRGIGIETAKNLILAGPKKVVLHDTTKVQLRDLGVNFYCNLEDVDKKTRGEACLQQLKELNPYVDVSSHDGEINEELLAQFDIVVITDHYCKKTLIQWNNFCRNRDKPIGFIYSGNLGLYGFTFVDFGPKFTCFDPNGEDPRSAILSAITNDSPAQVYTHEEKRHGFVDGDHVKFKEVHGMQEVNGQTYEVKVISPYVFTINVDATKFEKYVRNGIAEQVKIPQLIKFKSLEESLTAPLCKEVNSFENPDLEKWGRPEHLHIGLSAILEFHNETGRLPKVHDSTDAEQVLKFYETINSTPNTVEGAVKVDEVNKDLVNNLVRFGDAQVSCHAAFWGGIVAQEVVKFTGKFMPIRQWLHYENLELLPEGDDNRTPANTRYDDQLVIFGHKFQEKLMNQKFFMIGAGALGCEFIKQFALTGMCCGPKGKLTCTDDDNIEISNLNRQFLFRKQNVGKSKSETACAVGQKLNKDLNVHALKLRVSPENDVIFNDDFWEGLDGVANAVDNVKARMFVDSRCVFYGKHLFESGTLGTKCNTQVIIPHHTQSYSDSQDPAEESIPLCTLKNFPYQIEHTIQWARDFFEGIFVEGPNEYHKYAENPVKYLQTVTHELKKQPHVLRARLETIQKYSKYLEHPTQETCITLAREMFQDTFHNIIAQLLYNCPPEQKTESGQLFWSGIKRCPQAVNFDTKDPVHVEFIFATANLFAYIFRLAPLKDKVETAELASKVKVVEFAPKKVTINDNEKENKADVAEDDDVRIDELTKTLSSTTTTHNTVNTTEFEKDDDSNFHIDFIAAVANLRARNYTIEEVSRHKVKMIAGKIIPAIATATAMIVGTVGFEIFKFVAGKKPETFRNAFCNLAVPIWVFSEPLPPIKNKDKAYDEVLMGPVKAIPAGWSKWDKVDIQGPKTLEAIFTEVKERFGVNLSIVSTGEDTYLYHSGISAEKLKLTPDQLYKEATGNDYNTGSRFMEMKIEGEALDGVDALLPPMRYRRF